MKFEINVEEYCVFNEHVDITMTLKPTVDEELVIRECRRILQHTIDNVREKMSREEINVFEDEREIIQNSIDCLNGIFEMFHGITKDLNRY